MKRPKISHWTALFILLALAFQPGAGPAQADTGYTWQQMTQGMWGANPYGIAISPAFATDHLLLIGTTRGVFRSSDSGVTWAHCSGIDRNMAFNALRFSPTFASDHTAFVWETDKLYRSTDSGQTWMLFYTAPASIYALELSPAFASDHTALLGTYGQGLYRTTDSGATWQPANAGLTDVYILSAAFSPAYPTDQTMMVGTYGKGFFLSGDSGAHWSALSSGLPTYGTGANYNITSIRPSPAFASDHAIFARVLGYLYRTTNAGVGWSQVSGLPTNLVSFALAPDFATSHLAYATVHTAAGGKYIYISSNSGATWTPRLSDMPAWQIDMGTDALGNTLLFAVTSNGVARSENGGLIWNFYNQGLDVLSVTSLAVSPAYSKDQTIFAVSNNLLYSTHTCAKTWSQVHPETSSAQMRSVTAASSELFHAVAFSPAYATDQTVFAAADQGVYRSNDGGATWHLQISGLPETRVMAIGVSPNFASGRRVFAGLDTNGINVYLSEDGGETWRATGDTSAEAVAGFVFSPHYNLDGIIFSLHSGSSQVIRFSSGDYSVWINKNLSSVVDLALSPGYPGDQTIYALSYNAGKIILYYTSDDGASWEVRSYLPQDYVATDLLISPNFSSDHAFYASFYTNGVLRSTDSGQTWQTINGALGEQTVYTLAWLAAPGRLIAGTANSSAWVYSTGGPTQAIYIPLLRK
jgi:photosystem II stability/assembly factor-like uncharacterized protein